MSSMLQIYYIKKKDIMQNVDVKLNKTDLVVKNPFQN